MFSTRRLLAASLSSAVVLAGNAPAHAADPVVDAGAPWRLEEPAGGLGKGDWLVRARVAGLFPVNQTSTVGLIGGRIETPDMLLPDLQVAYFLTDHLSIEGQAGIVRTRPRIVDSIVGDFDIGTIWSAAASASIQYHFLPKARFNPYVGAGLSYSHPISIEPARGISDFEVNSLTSVMLQVGADYHIAGNWFGNAVAKYLFVPEQEYKSRGATFTSDADMVFVGAGIGYRF